MALSIPEIVRLFRSGVGKALSASVIGKICVGPGYLAANPGRQHGLQRPAALGRDDVHRLGLFPVGRRARSRPASAQSIPKLEATPCRFRPRAILAPNRIGNFSIEVTFPHEIG